MISNIFSQGKKDSKDSGSLTALKEQLEQQIKDISAEKSDVIRESQVIKEQLRRSEERLKEANDRASMYEELYLKSQNGECTVTAFAAEDDGSFQELTEMLDRLKKENESLTAENGLMKNENESFRRENEELKNEARSLENVNLELSEKLSRKEEEAAKSSSGQKIYTLEKELRNKEILLKHYEDAEKTNIILTQDLAKAKNLIKTLKKSISQLMEQMESQQKGVQYFAENITKQQNALREKLQEMTELQIKNVELQDSLSNMTDLYETLKKKNELLLHENEALKQMQKDAGGFADIISADKFEKKNAEMSAEQKAGNALSKCEDAFLNAKNLLSGLMDNDCDFEISEDDDDFNLMSLG